MASGIFNSMGSLFISRETLWTKADDMHHKCFSGDEKKLAEYLKDKECLSAINQPSYHDGTTPLEVAFSRGHTRIMEMLIEAGADVNQKYQNGMTLLHRACQNNNENMIKFLVYSGADVEAVNNDGLTPDRLSHLDVKSFWYEAVNEKNRNIDLFSLLLPTLWETPTEESPIAASSATPAASSARPEGHNHHCNMQ